MYLHYLNCQLHILELSYIKFNKVFLRSLTIKIKIIKSLGTSHRAMLQDVIARCRSPDLIIIFHTNIKTDLIIGITSLIVLVVVYAPIL